MDQKRVAYVVSDALVKVSSLLPSNTGRSFLVHSLASALGFFNQSHPYTNIRVFRPFPASRSDLCLYHDADYVDALLSGKEPDDPPLFGLEDDCPFFGGLQQYCAMVAGATLGAVGLLKSNNADVAIVWDGGRCALTTDFPSPVNFVL